LGIDSKDIHATRLNDQLLLHIPELQPHSKGSDILLAFEKDVGYILAEASSMGMQFTWQKLLHAMIR